MSGLITDLSSIGSIDRTTDVLEIVDVSANASFKVTVNALVGISGGSVVSTSDSQVLTNKTIGNTNAITVKASSLFIQDASDTTKQLQFSLSGITAGNIRTLTVPDASGTIVLSAATQTLTNKTLTAPVISGGSIDNSTITIDSLNGHTTPTIVTVAGLQINNGIVGANGVATASIADAAVTPAKLIAGTGSGWSWSSWTPSWTNLTVGNGTLTYAKYIQIGKTVLFRIRFVWGNTTSLSGLPQFSVPAAFAGDYAFDDQSIICGGQLEHIATSRYIPILTWSSGKLGISYISASVIFANISATAPVTWTTGDIWSLHGAYEAA